MGWNQLERQPHAEEGEGISLLHAEEGEGIRLAVLGGDCERLGYQCSRPSQVGGGKGWQLRAPPLSLAPRVAGTPT